MRVSFYKYPGVHDQAADGTKSGYGYAFMELLAAKAGWDVEYVGYDRPWDDMLDMLENGELDVVDFVGWRAYRMDKMLFSARPTTYSGCCIRTIPENVERFSMEHFEKWGHVRVGVLTGDQNELEFRNFAADNSIDYEIIAYPTVEDGVAAIRRGDVELVVYDPFTITGGLRNIMTYNPCRNHLVTRKDNEDLMAEINAAMAALDRENPRWMAELRSKYCPEGTVVAYLPERDDTNGAMNGYLREILVRLQEILGMEIDIKYCKADFSDADFSIPSFVCGVFFTPENVDRFSMPNHSVGRVGIDLLAQKGAKILSEDLRGRKEPLQIGYVEGDEVIFRHALGNYTADNSIAYELVPAKDFKGLCQGLQEGRFELVVRPAGMGGDLELVACCGHVDFFLAPPVSQKAMARSISEALKYLRLDERDFIYELEKRYFADVNDKFRTVCLGAYRERGLSIRRDDGTFDGFVSELVELVAKRKGWNYKSIILTYPEAQRALADGAIDLIGAAAWSEERAKLYDYSKFDVGPLYYSLMTTQEGRMRENRPDTWQDARIGVLRGSLSVHNLEKFLAERNVKWQAVEFTDLEEGEKSVREGRIEAMYTLANKDNGDLVPLAMLPTGLCYFCSNKQKPWIMQEFDEAVEELLRENNRCIVELYEKHLSSSSKVISLDVGEIDYVRSRKGEKIKVSFKEGVPPLVMRNPKTGKVSGFYPRLFERVSQRTGLDFECCLNAPDPDVTIDFNTSDLSREGWENRQEWLPLGVCWVKSKNPSLRSRGIVAVPVKCKEELRFVRNCGYDPLCLPDYGDCYRAVIDGRAEMTIDKLAVAQYYVDGINRFPSLQCQQITMSTFSMPVTMEIPTTADPRFCTILKKVRNSLFSDETDSLLFEAVYENRRAGVALRTVLLVVSSGVVFAGVCLLLVTYRANLARVANRAKTAFLFNMSHDIRTPMNAIIGYTDIALRHSDNQEKVSDCLRKIRISGGHLLSLINDILEMSRIEEGRMDIVSSPLDLREAIDNVRLMSMALAVPKEIDFKVELGELRNPYVYADELHVNECIINVISNAVKYTHAGGKVLYRIEQKGAAENGVAVFRFEVDDSGIGMSEEFQKHLFEAFSREKSSTVSKQEGTGLGLSIVKRIVDLCGGQLNVKSKQGLGTNFVIELPFKVMDDEAIAKFQAEHRQLEDSHSDRELFGKRVLVVEDNEMNREIATELLEEAGLTVETAEDGAVAVQKVAANVPEYFDFILMDIQMPVMDGYQATAEIRKMPGMDNLPIIALSANAFEEDRKKSLAAGMNAHEAKPIKTDVLFATMRRVMKG